jgi:hypothetical protein
VYAGDSHLVMAPVYGQQRRFHDSAALYNPQEAEALLGLIKSLLSEQLIPHPAKTSGAAGNSSTAAGGDANTAARDNSIADGSLVAALLSNEEEIGKDAGEEEESQQDAPPVRTDEVGVICMSRAQAMCVRNLLRQEGFGEVNVGTVDDFQGQEMRVIFVSSVLSHGANLEA